MPISPSRRVEIQGLVERLASSSLEDARVAAARLLVIGAPAYGALEALVLSGASPGADRAMRLCGCLGDRRAIALFRRIIEAGPPSRGIVAAELLAIFRQPEAARALGEALPIPALVPAVLVALHLLAREGVSSAEESIHRVQIAGAAVIPALDISERVEELSARLVAIQQDPLGEDVEPGPTSSADPVERYLGLDPESPEEPTSRREVASSVAPDQLAERLQREEDVRRLSLLSLLAIEVSEPRLILPLHRVVRVAQERLRSATAEDRLDLLALSARAHEGLAALGSRVAAVELEQALRQLDPAEIRVEHLRAAELIGSRSEVQALVPLTAQPGWLGATALRVLGTIVAREGVPPRSPLLRGLSKDRRRELARPAR